MTAFEVEKRALTGSVADAILVVNTLRRYRSAAQALSVKHKLAPGVVADVDRFIAEVLEAETDLGNGP